MTSERDVVQAGEVTAEQADESLRKLFDAGRRTRKDAFSTTWLLDVQLHIATLRAKLTEAERERAEREGALQAAIDALPQEVVIGCDGDIAKCIRQLCDDLRAGAALERERDAATARAAEAERLLRRAVERAIDDEWLDAARSHLQSLKAKEPTP